MKKTAVFVEGQAEQIFVQRLIEIYAATRGYALSVHRIGGGRRCDLYQMPVADVGDPHAADFIFLLIDCSSDERVVSQISDQFESLVAAAYSEIIGVRDVFPMQRIQLDKMRAAVANALPTTPFAPMMVFAVMEVEAWFIAESGHFTRLDPLLERDRIFETLGVDIDGDAEAHDHPSQILGDIYKLAGKVYDKSREAVSLTVDVLDFDKFRTDAGERAPSVFPLVEKIAGILAT